MLQQLLQSPRGCLLRGEMSPIRSDDTYVSEAKQVVGCCGSVLGRMSICVTRVGEGVLLASSYF